MRIARYLHENEEYYGVLKEQTVFCLPALAKRYRQELPGRLEEFISCGGKTMKTAEELLTKTDGMPHGCAINLDHIQTVSKAKIGASITTLTPTKMRELRDGILFALGFY